MRDDAIVLDGNAAAGVLGSVFAFDVTLAIVKCGQCGTPSALAELLLYGSTQAMTLRCSNCDAVNIRLLETRNGINLDLSGAARVEIQLNQDREN